jgi:succinate dehydrogenase hydrophobic anchor subunit
MREKNVMLLHYITGILILVAGGIHLSTVFLLSPYEESMKFDSSPLAVILQELHQGKTYKKAVSLAVTIVALALVVYGTRTILIAHQLAIL